MHEIYFYEDRHGNSPVYDYIQSLSRRSDKSNRINHGKMNDYIETLGIHGKAAGEPYIKHVEGDIWELRPIRNRVFFASWEGDGFILLHHFVKKSQKTPSRELEQAKRNLADIRERSGQQ